MKNKIKINFNETKRRKLLCIILLGLIALLQYFQLNISYMTLEECFSFDIRMQLLCSGSVLLVSLLLMLLTMRLHIACLVSSILFFLLSLVNHYVYLYVGEPFSPIFFSSVSLALGVLQEYSFSIDRAVLLSALCFGAELALALCIKKVYPERQRFTRDRVLFYGAFFLVMAVCAVGTNYRIYKNNNWLFNAGTYGYPAYFVQKSIRCINTSAEVPEGYSQERLAELTRELGAAPGSGEDYPDIILILNETFYDPAIYAEIEPDTPYLSTYESLKNAVKGYAISPFPMGGTNDSEFELLTGYSPALFSQRAPFTIYSDFRNVGNVARYLKELGYSTWAMHARDPLNYNRQAIWPDLGFDTVKFYDDFTLHEIYGHRQETDSANYEDMIRWYEEAGDAPRLMYLLTYQNHGGYAQNDSALDTVHVTNERGDTAEQADEYLTSIRMSDEALGELTDYFEASDRPAVICMVGDHSPGFLPQLSNPRGSSEEESTLLARKIPFLIWGNAAFGEIQAGSEQVLCMADLVPKLLDTAGLPLSAYYRYLLELSEAIPVRLESGYYQMADGRAGILSREDSAFDAISIPFYIEYADLYEPGGAWEELLEPPGRSEPR